MLAVFQQVEKEDSLDRIGEYNVSLSQKPIETVAC